MWFACLRDCVCNRVPPTGRPYRATGDRSARRGYRAVAPGTLSRLASDGFSSGTPSHACGPRAKLPLPAERQSGTNTKLPCFIGTRCNNAPSLPGFRVCADNDRPAFVFGMIELLDGRIKCIHVDMKYEAHAAF